MRPIDADELVKYLLQKGFYPAIVARAIERQPTINTNDNWIPVKDLPVEEQKENLPKDDFKEVLTCDAEGNIHMLYHHSSFKTPFGISPNHETLYPVVEWMPLPEPYKVEV